MRQKLRPGRDTHARLRHTHASPRGARSCGAGPRSVARCLGRRRACANCNPNSYTVRTQHPLPSHSDAPFMRSHHASIVGSAATGPGSVAQHAVATSEVTRVSTSTALMQ